MSVVAVEAAIVARLKAQMLDIAVPLLKAVYAEQEYAALPERTMVTPSAAVIYQGYTPTQNIKPGGIQEIRFEYLVVLNVRSAKSTDTGQGVRDEASPLIDAALAALLGFRPIAKFQPLKLEPAPGAALSDAGFGYYPLAFSTLATYRGTIN